MIVWPRLWKTTSTYVKHLFQPTTFSFFSYTFDTLHLDENIALIKEIFKLIIRSRKNIAPNHHCISPLLLQSHFLFHVVSEEYPKNQNQTVSHKKSLKFQLWVFRNKSENLPRKSKSKSKRNNVR